jgi:uncharacterized membrane protein YphA (DoxX/SURF4 family)
MLRLFSNFASGWPALGLLLIRLVAGVSLIFDGVVTLHLGQSDLPLIVSVLAVADGAMLVVGMWTPIAGFLAAAVCAGEILVRDENTGLGILLSAMGIGLALVGPGAISLDAWIFGLKKIDIEKLNGPPRR